MITRNKMICTFVVLKPYLGRHSGASPSVFYINDYVMSCSDRPIFLTLKLHDMNTRTQNQWQDNDFERRYWQKIHNLNRKEAPQATPDKTPVGQYVLHLVELINTEEA